MNTTARTKLSALILLTVAVFVWAKTLLGAAQDNAGLKSGPSREGSTTEHTPEPRTRDMVLWYRQPAEKWLDALPIGNGYMGAMVFGGIQQERIALNESSFWSGRPHDYNDTDAIHYFPQIRDLVFAGKFQEAE